MSVLEDRFWSKINKTDSCWLWTDAPNSAGYGKIKIPNTRIDKAAHVLSYEINVGEIPEGLFVCHHCDNRICVRPDHLFLGTHQDNMNDMFSKGRDNYGCNPSPGEANGNHKLLESEVIVIKRKILDGDNNKSIARLYKVHHSTISAIRRGKLWKHI